jgi:peptide/nickel transport system substrate-binding protein
MKRTTAALMALSSIMLGVIGVSGAPSGAVSNATVLTEETNVGVTFTDNFNPLNSNSVGSQMALNGLVYEPLMVFNTLKAGVSYPWLATSEVFSNGGKVVTFTIRSGAKWSDGQAVTANDVAYTFNLESNTPSVNISGLPNLAQPASVSGNKVTLTYSTAQYANQVALGSTEIIPEHIWSKYTNPASVVVTNPVGDGPYKLLSYNSQMIKYAYSSTFWGGKPAATQVDIPNITSNQAATQALAAHTLDWAGNDIPNIQTSYVNLDPTHNKYYYAPGSTVTLWFNLKKTAPDAATSCLLDPTFRKAVAESLNRSALSTLGETGYEPPSTSDSGLMPSQASYQGKYAKDQAATPASAATVSTLLTGAGYVLDANKFWSVSSAAAQTATGLKAGTECKFNVEDPAAYSDYASDAQLISSEAQAVGINVTADPVDTGAWYSDISAGTFDSMVHWGNGGTNPYTQFQNWLDQTAAAAGSANYGGYTNPAAETALNALAAAAPGSAAFQAAVTTLSGIMATDVPATPILYGADWDVYSTARFSGWVSPTNQSCYPGPGNEDCLPYNLMQLKLNK